MSTSQALKGLTAAVAAACLAVGAAGSAGAQGQVTVVPGDSGDGRTVIVNNPGMTVNVTSVNRETGQVQVQMQNNLGFTVFCEAPTQDSAARFGGTVTLAPVAEQAGEYYTRFQNTKAETVTIIQSGSTITIPLWQLTQFVPTGSVGAIAGEAVQLRSQIVEGTTRARVSGLYGTTPSFQMTNGATVTRTINLGIPTTNTRAEDKIGFFTVCGQGTNSAAVQGNAQLYGWTAFEEGWPPPVVIPENTGSLATGSLGSSGTDPVDPEPPIEEPPIDDDEGPAEP
ncbi:hypothetical protein [Dietzia natronolimnaea]|uniref:hypothetical protein n=1 Tax=Dietzia natronolimnaea TaxID=161920 RepID=UPI0015F86FBA|nr:hypothetical protein [Dietzia natronolimnaea]MBB1036564.1 hypothetical protein [Dietzia natronolimnaea]